MQQPENIALKLNRSNPKIVVLCGSSRFCDIMAVCAWLIERDENAITMGLHFLPKWYAKDIPDHLAEIENVAKQMDQLHLRKIDLCDEIFIVNFDFYVGNSTKREINYALKKNKTLRYFMRDSIGLKVLELMQKL